MLKVLLSNDDGVHAAGISALRQALKNKADVFVFAPDRDRSGASNSLSLQRPIRVNEIEPQVVSVQGTPTDCVHLAATGLLDSMPDLVLSGMNAGSNLGDDVWYSGTVAAAMEGCFMKLPALAISVVASHPKHFDSAARVVLELIDRLQVSPIPGQMFLNVNIPDVPYDELQGFEVTRLGTRHSAEPTIKSEDPRGREIYWVGPPGKQADAGPGTDFYAVSQNKVSVTPLRIDITDYAVHEELKSWLQQEAVQQ